MNKLILTCLIITFVIKADFVIGQNEDAWVLTKTKNGIEIFTLKTEASAIKSFKARMIVPGKVEDFVAVLHDVEAMPDWGYNIKNACLLERSGDTVQIYYAEASMPFPFSNRDGIYLNTFVWNSETKKLRVDIQLLPEYMEAKDKLVRVKGNGDWHVNTLKDGNLEIIFRMQVDPGGEIPAWLVNMFINETPFDTMTNIREMMKKAKYRHRDFEFIH
jgi:hypothetical protein